MTGRYIAAGLYSEVVNRGSTVILLLLFIYTCTHNYTSHAGFHKGKIDRGHKSQKWGGGKSDIRVLRHTAI